MIATNFVTNGYNLAWFAGKAHNRTLGGANFGNVNIRLESLATPKIGFGPRPVRVEGFIMPVNVGKRDTPPQPSAGFYTYSANDVDPGHVMALELGGPDIAENVVPQWKYWQRHETWRKMEQELSSEAKKTADNSRPYFGAAPTRSIFYRVDVVYKTLGNYTPTLTGWAFPKEFYITAYVADLTGANPQAPIYNNHKLAGNPDNW